MLEQNSYDCIILGSGLCGMSAAERLVNAGKSVLIMERDSEQGGLLRGHRFDGFTIEHYYHHVFTGDDDFFALVNKLGLSNLLVWHPASVGHLIDNKIYRLDTPLDILKFTPLSIWDKFRLALAVLKIKLTKDFAPLDKISAKKWLLENCGKGVYENFFKPPLTGKFGDCLDEISAAWLLTRIKLRSNRSVTGEKLCYMQGGFQKFIDVWKDHLLDLGVQIATSADVERILLDDKGNVSGVVCEGKTLSTSKVISTIPSSVLLKICDFDAAYKRQLSKIRYQISLCSTLGLKKSITNTYWINIKSDRLPFALMLEHTNFHNDPAYGCKIVYLASYCQTESDSLWNLSDEQVMQKFENGLISEFNLKKEDILWHRFSRTRYSAPLYTMGYLDNLPSIKSTIKGLYVTGMMRSYPERSVNASIKLGLEAANILLAD